MKKFSLLIMKIILFLIIMIIGITFACLRDLFGYPAKWAYDMGKKLVPKKKLT